MSQFQAHWNTKRFGRICANLATELIQLEFSQIKMKLDDGHVVT